jgi:hypothetical protein
MALDWLGKNIGQLWVVKPNQNETCLVELMDWIVKSVDLGLTHWTRSMVLDKF